MCGWCLFLLLVFIPLTNTIPMTHSEMLRSNFGAIKYPLAIFVCNDMFRKHSGMLRSDTAEMYDTFSFDRLSKAR